jgi:hypothetical protein
MLWGFHLHRKHFHKQFQTKQHHSLQDAKLKPDFDSQNCIILCNPTDLVDNIKGYTLIEVTARLDWKFHIHFQAKKATTKVGAAEGLLTDTGWGSSI